MPAGSRVPGKVSIETNESGTRDVSFVIDVAPPSGVIDVPAAVEDHDIRVFET
jgi:hypothetical protein